MTGSGQSAREGGPPGRAGRLAEAVALYGLVPVAWVWAMPGRFVLPLVWGVALCCAMALARNAAFDRRSWAWGTIPSGTWGRVMIRFLIGAAVMTILLAWLYPERLFELPRERPRIWWAIVLLYPVLSVYPQGIIYRAFFEMRYVAVLPARAVPWAAAAAFSWAHIVFGNGWALLFTFIGGWFFHDTWTRTRSLLMAGIEQSLYGLWIFTVGWGSFLYHGTARLAERAAGS